MEQQGTSKDFEAPAFARAGSETTELRGECPRQIVDVLDAIAMAENVTRTAVVNRVLGEWAQRELHRSMLIERVARRNPAQLEAVGGARQ